MANQTKKLLNLAFLGLSSLPFAFSKMETYFQEFKTQMNGDTIEVKPIKPCRYFYASTTLSSLNWYYFLYDKTTGYSIGGYVSKPYEESSNYIDFFNARKTARIRNLRFFNIKEKSKLNMDEIQKKYTKAERIKVEREITGKLFIKDLIGYEMNKELWKKVKPELINYRTQKNQLHAQKDQLYAQWDQLNAQLQPLYAQLQPFYAQWDQLYAQSSQLYAQWDQLHAQETQLNTQLKKIVDPLIKDQPHLTEDNLFSHLDMTLNRTLISDAYITKGCMHLWNTYEPLWTNTGSFSLENALRDAIKIKPSFYPQKGISIKNKKDGVFINTIDFQQALSKHYDLDQEERTDIIAQSICSAQVSKRVYDLGKIAYNLSERREQLDLLSKSKILKVYAVMKGKQGKNSLVWGLAEDNETKKRFHWFTDLKADISLFVK